jgi:hypothetical protein
MNKTPPTLGQCSPLSLWLVLQLRCYDTPFDSKNCLVSRSCTVAIMTRSLSIIANLRPISKEEQMPSI